MLISQHTDASDNTLTQPLTCTPRYTLEDLQQFGRHYGVSYRLTSPAQEDNPCLIQGRIDELPISPGATLVSSQLRTFHDYEAHNPTPPWISIVALLDGQARLGGTTAVTLSSGMGVIMVSKDGPSQSAWHPTQQRLRGLNLSISTPLDLVDESLAEQVHQALKQNKTCTRSWSLSEPLQLGLASLTAGQWQGSLQRLMGEGLSLQLLAYGLSALETPERTATALSPRDCSLLARVRDQLHQEPGADHSLQHLARLACMSPSALRLKFRQAYGCSVMSYLRQQRLELARHYLAQGWRVQDAAQFVGYRHASNFATAYRQHFGTSPRGSL